MLARQFCLSPGVRPHCCHELTGVIVARQQLGKNKPAMFLCVTDILVTGKMWRKINSAGGTNKMAGAATFTGGSIHNKFW
jgi:hypothetical protein